MLLGSFIFYSIKAWTKWKTKNIALDRTVPKSSQKIIETETILISIEHMYMTVHNLPWRCTITNLTNDSNVTRMNEYY